MDGILGLASKVGVPLGKMPRRTSPKGRIMERGGAIMFKGSECRELCFSLLMVAGPLCAAQHEPLKLNPQNPHYLDFRGKPTVLVTSGEHYGAVINLDFNYAMYLKQLQRDHLNLTRVFAGSYREIDKPDDAIKGGYTIDRNTLAPRPSRFISPWKSAVQADGTVKFDLHHWNHATLNGFTTSCDRRVNEEWWLNLACSV